MFHNHSFYSIQDAIVSPAAIAKKFQSFGLDFFSITDHGTVTAFPDAFAVAQQLGMQFIPGYEAYMQVREGFRYSEISKERAEVRKRQKNGPQLSPEELKIWQEKEHRHRKNHHLTLLAKNQKGLENIFNIVSNTEMYYKPITTFETLQKYSEGLICLSGCLGGELCHMIDIGEDQLAEELVIQYKNLFKDDYYIEIQYHEMPNEDELRIYRKCIELAKKYKIQMIGTNDSHYELPEDETYHQLYKAMCFSKDIDLQDNQDNNFHGTGYHIASPEELIERFSKVYDKKDVAEMFDYKKISSKCDKDIQIVSKFELPNADEMLLKKVEEGWEKYRKGTQYEEQSKERYEYEMSVITQKKFSQYFLNTLAIVDSAKKNGLWTGPGRGSAGGCEIVYLLGITDTDPLKYGLYFERFMNIDRNEMPDIDIDIESCGTLDENGEERSDIGNHGRDIIISDLMSTEHFQFWGKIQNVIKASKLVLFKKLCSSLGVEFKEANAFTTNDYSNTMFLLDEKPDIFEFAYLLRFAKVVLNVVDENGNTVERDLDEDAIKKRIEELQLQEEENKKINKDGLDDDEEIEINENLRDDGDSQLHLSDMNWDNVYRNMNIIFRLNGIPWGSSIHASGVILAEENQILPKVDGQVITFNGKSLEKMGYTKYDMLSLDTLDLLKAVFNKNDFHPDYKSEQFLSDRKVYDFIAEGKEIDFVFQLGGFTPCMMFQGVKDKSKIYSIEQLSEVSAINRPGPLGMNLHKKWIMIMNGEKYDISPEEKAMSKLLKNSFGETHSGLVIYQEDVMKLCSMGSGFSMVDSNNFRKAIGKKDKELMDSYHGPLVDNWKNREVYTFHDDETGEDKYYLPEDMVQLKNGKEMMAREIMELVESGKEVEI